MNNKVEVIAPTSKTMCLKGNVKYKLIRTCAYCRVSTDNEDQKTSYDSQRIHYKNMIEENPDWEFVGIYADEGITGTQTKKREQFNQMMSDALNGKIDLILAKSISRFARNTVDTLNCVRLLREHNVDVYFEKENIHTLGLSNELFLTLYSAFAQAESESISENVKAGVRMKMKRGELVGKYAPFGYLYDKEKDLIYPDESKKDIVTYIFEEYAKGVGFRTIALNLNSLGIPSPSNLKWCHASVRRIIINKKYVGDLKTGKYYTENVLTHKKKVNYGEKEQYFTSNHHEPIISRELWDKCQEILTIRSKIIKPDGNRDKFSRKYAFSSKIFCGICGERFIRRSYKIRSNNKEVAYWICRSHRNKIECSNLIHYKQEELEDIFVIVYNKLFQDSDKYIHSFMKKVNEVINENHDYTNQKKIREEISKLENKLSNLIDLQLDDSISKDILNQKNLEISNKIKEYEQQLKTNENIETTRKQKLEQIDKISNTLKQYKGLTKFSEEVFNSLVDKIIIGEKLENGDEDFYKIKFILKTGELINENLPNGKLDIGTNFGKYGFTITKQELEEKEDNVSAYVLQRHTRVQSTNYFFFIQYKFISFSYFLTTFLMTIITTFVTTFQKKRSEGTTKYNTFTSQNYIVRLWDNSLSTILIIQLFS